MSDTPNIPGPKSGIFGFKSVSEFRKDPIAFLMNLTEEYGDVVHFQFGPQFDVYLVAHPDHIRELLVKRASQTVKLDKQADPMRKVAPKSLMILEGDDWKKHRKLVAPAFHTKRIQEYIGLIQNHTLRLIEAWEDGEVYTMHAQMMQVTMGIIGEILFNIQDIEKDAAELAEALHVILDMFMLEASSPMPVPDWVPTRRNLRENAAIEIIHSYLDEVIQERRATGVDHGDVLSALLHAADEDDGDSFTDEEARDELTGLFLDGHDTATILLMWALYVLATQPDLQQQLYEEVSGVIRDQVPSLEELNTMTLTDRILQETMRMYPPAWSLFLREAVEDVQLGDHTIPAGGVIWVSPYVVHHDSRWWADPETFNPARFEGDWREGKPSYAYMAFGGGPRVCMGSHLAEMETEVILATIVKHFIIELAEPDQVASIKPHFTLHEAGGIPLRVRKRQ